MTKILEYKLEFDGWIASGSLAAETKEELFPMLQIPVNALLDEKRQPTMDRFGGATDPEGKGLSMYLRPKDLEEEKRL